MSDKLLTINEACAEVGVSRRTMYLWITAKKVRHERTAGGSIRVYQASLWQKKPDVESQVSA